MFQYIQLMSCKRNKRIRVQKEKKIKTVLDYYPGLEVTPPNIGKHLKK